MWELYAFWVFVPILLQQCTVAHPEVTFNVPLLSFFIIGSGGIACVISGYLSLFFGSTKTAQTALALSAGCCLLFPVIFLIPLASFFL
jgi:hypothetical protein